MSITTKFLALLLIVLSCSGCEVFVLAFDYSPVSEFDEVKNVQRERLNIAATAKGPYLKLFQQKIIKTTYSEGIQEFKVYDLLRLDIDAYPLEDELYWIIDGVVFEIFEKQNHVSFYDNLKEEYTNVTNVDSTSTEVLAGINNLNYRSEKIYYKLNNEMLNALDNAKEVKVRYYIKDEMITYTYLKFSIESLKKLML